MQSQQNCSLGLHPGFVTLGSVPCATWDEILNQRLCVPIQLETVLWLGSLVCFLNLPLSLMCFGVLSHMNSREYMCIHSAPDSFGASHSVLEINAFISA